MSNRTFAAQSSIAVELSPERERQGNRLAMAEEISDQMGEARDYGSNRISEYLKMPDGALRDAANQAFHCSRFWLSGFCVTGVGLSTFTANTLAFGFNRVSMASAIATGLGVVTSAYSEYKSRQLKKDIDAYIQRLDNA